MKRAILGFIFLFLGIVCIASPKKKRKKVQISGLYELVSIKEGNNLKKNLIPSTEINLMEKEHSFSVYLGCNHINGELKTMANNQMSSSIISSTRMACPGNIEDLFKNNIELVTNFRENGNQLLLLKGNIVLIILQRKETKTTPSNPEGVYKLEKLWDGKSLKKDNYSKSKITIEKGRLSATVGCNGIGGDFKTQGNKVLPLKLMMTEMFCEKYNDLEQKFVNALNEVDSYELKGNQLELYVKGKLVIVGNKE